MSFRREKFIEYGGPDGGDGGRGGDVYIEAVDGLNTLIDYRYQQHFKAGTGGHGMGKNRHGANGEDAHLRVPVGTQVLDEDRETLLADLDQAGASITLLRGDLMGLVEARHLSQATMRNIRQNLAFAFLYNAAGIPVAAGVLYPVFGILLSPMLGAAAMALSSVSVIGNALRLSRARLRQ